MPSNFKHGDIVYWKNPEHKIGFVPDATGHPQKFVVVAPKRKYCVLVSLNHWIQGYSYQNLENFDMSQLILASEVDGQNETPSQR